MDFFEKYPELDVDTQSGNRRMAPIDALIKMDLAEDKMFELLEDGYEAIWWYYDFYDNLYGKSRRKQPIEDILVDVLVYLRNSFPRSWREKVDAVGKKYVMYKTLRGDE